MILTGKISRRKRSTKVLSNPLPSYIRKISKTQYLDLRDNTILNMKRVSFSEFFGIDPDKEKE